MIRISERGGNEAPAKDEQLLIQVSPSTRQKGNVFFRYRNRWESLWQYLVNVLSKSSTLKAKWRGEDLELTLKNTTVTAGSYTETNITVGADGRITQASNGAKTSIISGNETSAVYYPSVKGIVDWIKQGLTAYLTTLVLTKTTPVDADSLLLNDSADSNKLKLLSWANIKATLKNYFDTLYTSVQKAYLSSGDATLFSTITATNITGLSFALEANSRYYISGILFIGSGNASGGQFGATIPTGASMKIVAFGMQNSAAASKREIITTSGVLVGAFPTAFTSGGYLRYDGTIETGANAGNFQVQWACTAGGYTITCYKLGTTLTLMKL